MWLKKAAYYGFKLVRVNCNNKAGGPVEVSFHITATTFKISDARVWEAQNPLSVQRIGTYTDTQYVRSS